MQITWQVQSHQGRSRGYSKAGRLCSICASSPGRLSSGSPNGPRSWRRSAAVRRLPRTSSTGTLPRRSRSSHAELVNADERVGPELVRQLMCELDQVTIQPRLYRTTTVRSRPQPGTPDLLRRDFLAELRGSSCSATSRSSRPGRGWLWAPAAPLRRSLQDGSRGDGDVEAS